MRTKDLPLEPSTGLPALPPFEITLKTATRRTFPSNEAENYDNITVKAAFEISTIYRDKQRLTFMAHNVLNMVSWVDGYLNSYDVQVQPVKNGLSLAVFVDLSLEQWQELHIKEEDLGLWLCSLLEPAWLAFCIREAEGKDDTELDVVALADVLLLVLAGSPIDEARFLLSLT